SYPTLPVILTLSRVASFAEPFGHPQIAGNEVRFDFDRFSQLALRLIALAGVVKSLGEILADKWIERLNGQKIPVDTDELKMDRLILFVVSSQFFNLQSFQPASRFIRIRTRIASVPEEPFGDLEPSAIVRFEEFFEINNSGVI